MWSIDRTPRTPGHLLLWLILMVSGIAAVRAADTDLLEDELELPSAWIKGLDARAWSGYKDNVLLGELNTEASPFVAGGLDLTLYRVPIEGWEFLFFSSGEYLRYLNAPQVDDESTVIAQAQVKKSFAAGWKSSLSAEYFYLNQVFDASTTEDDLQAAQIEGHGFTLRPGLIKDLGNNFQLELETPASRQIFADLIDDYWEFGPKLVLERQFDRKASLSFAYQFSNRIHDTRESRDSNGRIQPRTILEFYQHELSAGWRQFWDAERRWRTVTRLSLQWNQDNGGGYYDYLRSQVTEQLRYQAPTWEIRAEARVSYYHYDSQRIDDADSPTRKKMYLRLNLRAEKTVAKSFKLFAQYEHERAVSNLELDDYTVNMISGGLAWEY